MLDVEQLEKRQLGPTPNTLAPGGDEPPQQRILSFLRRLPQEE